MKYISNNSEIIFDTRRCVPSIYLIMEKENINIESSFKITIKNIKLSQNEYCKYAPINSFIFCGAANITECRNCENEFCTLIQCGKEIENPINYIDQFETYNELCVPRNTSDRRKKLMCKNFNDVNTYRIFNECNYESNYKFVFMTSELYFTIVFIILAIALIIIYYNNYLIRKKQKPFNTPSIFPETIFPDINNINNEYQNMNKNEDIIRSLNYYSSKYNNI